MGEYSKSAIIKYTRKALGMTQEELAEFICEPATLARYESGKIDPTDDKFLRLMEKMGEQGNVFLFPVKTDLVEVAEEMEDLQKAVEQQDWDNAEKIRHNLLLNEKFILEYPENRQYLKRIEVIISYNLGKIDEMEAIRELEEAWGYTCARVQSKEFSLNHIYRETEILILHNIAVFYKILGQFEEACIYYERLDRYLQRDDMINDCKPVYVIYLGYSNVLGMMGRYEESIEICFRAIRRALMNNQVNYLYNFYYNIGRILQQQNIADKRNEAKLYVWLAYQLCQNYPENKQNLQRIKEVYEQLN